MKLLVLLAALVAAAALLAVPAAAGPSAADKAAGEARLQKLLKRSQDRPMIGVNGHDFDDLVGSGYRPYRLLVWVTSNSGSCAMCNEMRDELRLVAATYEAGRYRAENGTVADSPQHRVFLVELDGTRHYDFFKTLGVQYIPHLYHVPPSKNPNRKPWDRLFKDEVTMQGGWKAEDIERNLRTRTRLSMDVERPPEPINWAGVITTLAVLAGAVGFFATVGRPLLAQLVSPRAMMIVSFAFYAFNVAGGMYNRVRSTPYSGPNGETFAPGSRSQYVAETVTVGTLYVCMALALIALNTGVHVVKANTWVRSLSAFGVLGLFMALWKQIEASYLIKNPGYAHRSVF